MLIYQLSYEASLESGQRRVQFIQVIWRESDVAYHIYITEELVVRFCVDVYVVSLILYWVLHWFGVYNRRCGDYIYAYLTPKNNISRVN